MERELLKVNSLTQKVRELTFKNVHPKNLLGKWAKYREFPL